MKRERKPLRPDDYMFPGQPKSVTWIKTDWFCPSCGRRDMWQRSDDAEDYYHDCSAACHTCGGYLCCVEKVKDQ